MQYSTSTVMRMCFANRVHTSKVNALVALKIIKSPRAIVRWQLKKNRWERDFCFQIHLRVYREHAHYRSVAVHRRSTRRIRGLAARFGVLMVVIVNNNWFYGRTNAVLRKALPAWPLACIYIYDVSAAPPVNCTIDFYFVTNYNRYAKLRKKSLLKCKRKWHILFK